MNRVSKKNLNNEKFIPVGRKIKYFKKIYKFMVLLYSESVHWVEYCISVTAI